MEKGGGKLIPIRTVEQQRKRVTQINGWLPAVDLVGRSSKYSAKAKVHHPSQRRNDSSERSLCNTQQFITAGEKNRLRGHGGYYSYSSSKHFPNYNFHNSRIIDASPISDKTRRPKSCMHCAHLFNNGAQNFSSIHSTLAYAKCRCHRPDTSKIQNDQGNLMEDRYENSTSDKLFKKVEFPHITKDSLQTVLPSLNVDHQPEQPLMEASLSELTSSSSKLPTLKSGSVVSTGSSSQQQLSNSSCHRLLSSGMIKKSRILHNSTVKLSPITEASTIAPTNVKKKDNFKVTDLWKYVNEEKRERLIKLFKKLDIDDDGHISWKEFLSCLNEMDHALKHYLHELYKLTSEATYFGKQEFVTCHSVHELLHCKKLPSSLYLNVDRYYLDNFILPFLIKMSTVAAKGQVNINLLERNTLHTSLSSQLVFARAKQWTSSNEVSLLQLLSYAPVILSPV